jgi:hypothetical protein
MLAKILGPSHGVDLLEGNVHAMDSPPTHELKMLSDTPPSSLMDSTASPHVTTLEGERVGAHSLGCSTLGVEGCAGASKWELGRLTSKLIIYTDLHKTKQQVG